MTRILALIPYYLPGYRGGGPIRTLAAMVAAHRDRHDFAVLTSDHDWSDPQPLPVTTNRWVDVDGAAVRYLPTGAGPLALARTAATVVRTVRAARPDVLYINGMFPIAFALAPVAAARAGMVRARVVLAPRGELGAGALALKAGKKGLFLRAARVIGLYRDVTWHASTALEAQEVEAVFPGARVLVRENETMLPRRAEAPAPLDGTGNGPLRLLFVSRIAPKKGLHVVLAALADVPEPVTLDIVGDGDPPVVAALRAQAARLPARHSVHWHGALPPQQLAGHYATHELLALPTAHENFGHVIPEALARACPVLLPDTTPWTHVVAAGGGRIVPSLAPADWAQVLSNWARRSAHQRWDARIRAARAYDEWAATSPRESVFDLL